MKKLKLYIILPCLVWVSVLLFQCSPVQHAETQNLLEQRLDTLLGKLSMQEKIEQLYYKTDKTQDYNKKESREE